MNISEQQLQNAIAKAKKNFGPIVKNNRNISDAIGEFLWTMFSELPNKVAGDSNNAQEDIAKDILKHLPLDTEVKTDEKDARVFRVTFANGCVINLTVGQKGKVTAVQYGIDSKRGYTNISYPIEDACVVINEFQKMFADLKDTFTKKVVSQDKRAKCKVANATTAKALLVKALEEKGYTYSIECRDCRALVRIKVNATRMIVLNVLYKNIYEEIPQMFEAFETIKGIIDKFGRYVFVGNCRNTQWTVPSNDTNPQAELEMQEQDGGDDNGSDDEPGIDF